MSATTLYLSPNVQQRLRLEAQRSKMSMSKYAEKVLDEALAREEQGALDTVYAETEKLIGAFKSDDPHLSSTIDEILYGENGAWQGTEPMTPEEVEKERNG